MTSRPSTTRPSTRRHDLAPDETARCAVRREIMGRVGDKWSSLVILMLEDGPRRYSDMSRSSRISQRMLTLTLRELHRDGLVTRTASPDAVTYALTPSGRSFCALVAALVDWADEQHDGVVRSRARFDAESRTADAGTKADGAGTKADRAGTKADRAGTKADRAGTKTASAGAQAASTRAQTTGAEAQTTGAAGTQAASKASVSSAGWVSKES